MDWQAEEDDEERGVAREQTYACPYCWQQVSPPLEADLEGELVWDCEVCCRPWLIKICVTWEGEREVSVERAQN